MMRIARIEVRRRFPIVVEERVLVAFGFEGGEAGGEEGEVRC